MKWLAVTLLAILSSADAAWAAEPDFQVGQPIYSGNGCPKGTMNITWAPDNLSFSIIFDQFITSISPTDKVPVSQKRCHAIIPMVLPKGFSVTVENVDFRGFILLPAKAKAKFYARYGFLPSFPFLSRPKQVIIKQKFKTELADDYILTGTKDIASSSCGGLVYLRIDNVLTLKGHKGDDAQMTLDSTDGTGRSNYNVKLALKECRGCNH